MKTILQVIDRDENTDFSENFVGFFFFKVFK